MCGPEMAVAICFVFQCFSHVGVGHALRLSGCLAAKVAQRGQEATKGSETETHCGQRVYVYVKSAVDQENRRNGVLFSQSV